MPEIPDPKNFAESVFHIPNEKAFREIALAVFRHQFSNNGIYGAFCHAIGKTPENVFATDDIPFLPISFFKSHVVKSGSFDPEAAFASSGTTGATTSRHYLKDLSLYEKSFRTCFDLFYGPAAQYCILGLLPSYLEQGGSSLVYMVHELMKQSGHEKSGFYLHDHRRLCETLLAVESSGQRTILFGVTYALLDFAEAHAMPLKNTVLMETGGMKGRKKELTKQALYEQLKSAFSVNEIHSEYGMTELLSQAYAVDGRYRCPPWMKVVLRDETDPFHLGVSSGAVNVIDLANLWSCSFVATEDLGRIYADGSFEVLGRMDNTDIRGCSQLAL